MAPAAFRPQRVVERLSERAPGCRDLRLGLSGRDLEREVERRVLREQSEHVVEHRDTRRDLSLAGAVDVDASVELPGLIRLAHYASTRSIEAPSARRRSSIRS